MRPQRAQQQRGLNEVLEQPATKQATVAAHHSQVGFWKRLQTHLPLGVLAVGLLVTSITTTYFSQTAEAQDRLLFENEVLRAKSEVESRLATYTAIMRASRALLNAKPDLSPSEFRAFVASLDVRQRYPGLQGLGYVQRVDAADLPALTEKMRASEHPGFNVYPNDPRDEYYPIVLLEPQDERNRIALGFDMSSEAIRLAAMERAAEEGTLAASGKIKPLLNLEDKKQAVLVLYLPVYDTPAIPATPAERRVNLRGYVYSPLRASDFLQSILGSVSLSRLHVEVFDGTPSPESVLREVSSLPTAHFRADEQVTVGGRQWLMRCASQPTFEAQSRRAWTPILGIGQLVTTLLLFGLAYAETKARVRAETRTQELRQTETERGHLLAEAQAARATAEQANRAKDEFLSVVSHELRTPLNTLAGWVRMLRSRTLNEQQRIQALEGIERNIRTQTHLTEDLLAVSQFQAGQFRLTTCVLTVADTIAPVLATARFAAEAKGVRLNLDIAPDTGQIVADPQRLPQILSNVLLNAIKFTPIGGLVSCIVRRGPENIEFIIHDSGKGITAEFLPHVFESFRQEDNATTRGYGGLGLGLAIAWQLCELHGGTISAHSEGLNKGSRFVITLPVNGGI